jgi:hypothetical protein
LLVITTKLTKTNLIDLVFSFLTQKAAQLSRFLCFDTY